MVVLARSSLLLLLSFALAGAQDTRIDRILKELQQTKPFTGVSISPDGAWVTWVQPAGEGKSEILLLNRSNLSAKPHRLTAGDGQQAFDESSVSWAPDSKELAFFSDADSDQQQLYVASVPDGKARRLTNLNGYLTDIHWSRDGKQIAFLFAENGGGAGPLAAAPAQTGEIESEIHNQRLAIVNASGGEVRQISTPALNIYEYDWSPNGDRFAVIAAPGPADNNWWIAQLYTLDASSGQMKPIYHPPADRQLAVPRWSPDGKQIAFIGGLMSDQGFIGGDIFVTNADGGEAHDITAGRKTSPNWFTWRSDDELILTEAVDGGGAISMLRPRSGESETLWKGTEQIHDAGNYPNFSLASDGRTSALIRTSWEQAPEIYAGAIGNWQQLTHENSSQQPHWGKAESLIWSDDGMRIQGWLLYPANFDPSKRYPMIVEIHGGPSGMRANYWPTAHFDMSAMAGLGYFVFFPNARGSYGEGEAYTRANIKDFGGGDLRDILAGLDTVIKKVPVDNNRIGVAGWSYGGYMTMWTVTQTHRFHAAVAGAGIADWLSYYGENLIDKWMIPFFGASVYDDPKVYAKSSPINYIKQVRTPTLVIVGESDAECPAPQSFEFWHALKTLNVPTKLVVYAGEGHGFHNPQDDVDRLRRTLNWFDKYLGGNGAER